VEKKMGEIKFSVVVPTRERGNTLEATIRTCVTQNYDNFEIIVSDNFSQDDTKEVVDSFRDKRIVYVNTGKRVSMAENFEFALAQVSGDFVIVLGDDDALLPGSLNELFELIRNLKCEAITWKGASYFWPCCVINRTPNLLVIPLYGRLYKRNTSAFLKDVLSYKQCCFELPSIYRGVVSSRLINYVTKLSGGQFIHSMIPDIYSSIVMSASIDTYYYSTRPYSVFGQSQHSTGASYFFGSNKQSDRAAERQFFNEANIPCHNNIIFAPSIYLILAEVFMQAREHFPPMRQYDMDLRELIRMALKEVAHAPRERYDRVVKAIHYLAEKNSLGDYADRILKDSQNVPCEHLIGGGVPRYTIFRPYSILDCSRYGVSDVYQASLLCKFMLEQKKGGVGHLLTAIGETTIKIAKKLFEKWDNLTKS
jgi:glycosyltransferase involved in cell wall biosynthesis